MKERSCCRITCLKSQHLCAGATLFSAWGDRMWNFAIGLYLIKLTPNSVRLAAIYGLVWTSFAIIFTPALGDWIDRNHRLKVIRYSLIIQNVLVITDALILLVMFTWKPSNTYLLTFLYILIVVLGASANVVAQGEKISIAKDWIVVVCKDDTKLLAESNALLRRIDLTVAIISPIAVGFAMSAVSTLASILFICAWDLLSFFAEYFLLLKVYNNVPELSVKRDIEKAESKSNEDTPNGSVETDAYFVKFKSNFDIISRLKGFILGWKVYWNQDVFLAGLTLGVVYFTALGFNAITSGYAYTQGLSEFQVSMCFGGGSLTGIFGTLLFPYMRSKLGLLKTGCIGSLFQLSMLMICVAAVWAPGSPSLLIPSNWQSQSINKNLSNYGLPTNSSMTTQSPSSQSFSYTSIIMMMAGIILSRPGLWILDLAITQLQQETISEDERGTVGGVQYAINEVFDLSHFIVTIFLPKPNEFGYLTLLSFGAIACSSIIFLTFAYQFPRRKKAGYEYINGGNIENGHIDNNQH